MSVVLERLREWLRSEGVSFREVQHSPTFTSAESAAARNEPLQVGGKALLLKCDNLFGLFVLRADFKLDSLALKNVLGIKKTRFATPQELAEKTDGLVPGSVPPFGEPILPFPLHVDEGVFENDRIAFNAGSLTDSMVLGIEDYRRVANPTRVFRFGLNPDAGSPGG